MKKIYCLVVLLAALLSMQSCGFEEKDLFSDSSANRITAKTKEYTTLLESSPKGWLLKYGMGGEELSGGGTNILAKFKDGTATLSSDLETNVPAWQEASSPYSVSMETGPVLAFDVYNPVLHYFTEPHADQLKGQEADFEFIIMKVSNDTIVLQGKKYHTTLYMTRLADDFDVTAFRKGVDKVRNDLVYMDYTVKNGDKAVGLLEMNDAGTLLSGTVGDKSVSLPFVYTATGIHLLDTLQVDGKNLFDFSHDAVAQTFKGDGVTLAGVRSEGYENFEGTYQFHWDGSEGMEVELTPLKYARTYKMTGYSFNGIAGTFIVKYENGQLAFAAQTLEGSTPLLRMFLVGYYLQQYDNEELVSQSSADTPGDYVFVSNGVGTSYGLCISPDDGSGKLTGVTWSPFAYLWNVRLTKK